MDKSQDLQFDLHSTTQTLELILLYSPQGRFAIDFKGNMKMETESQSRLPVWFYKIKN